MSIQIESLERSYGAVRALKGVSLTIESGGIVGLLGPNGAGKTTLVEILEGLREPTRGRVSVLGLDPQRDAHALRQRLGAQLQSTSMPQDLTATEVLRRYGAFYARALPPRSVLERVGLAAKATALVRELSGGQRQRLALGMALVHDPELLILDEPTTGLDPVARRQLHEMIRGSSSELKTMRSGEQATYHVMMKNEERLLGELDHFDYASPDVKEDARDALQNWVKELRNEFLGRTTPELNAYMQS